MKNTNKKINERYLLRIASKPDKQGRVIEITNVNAFHFALGSVLGDAGVNKRDGCLDLEQRSARFIMWKRNLAVKFGLAKAGLGNFKQKFTFSNGECEVRLPLTSKTSVKSNGPKGEKRFRRGWGFTTTALFHYGWREAFYCPKDPTKPVDEKKRNQYRKRLPSNIKNLFWGDLALAIFYLDDGGFDWQKNTVRISTGEWTREECNLMLECLNENFNIKAKSYPLTGQPEHLFILRESYPEFYRRVYPYVEDFRKNHPRYALNSAMRNKVLPEPTQGIIGRPKKLN